MCLSLSFRRYQSVVILISTNRDLFIYLVEEKSYYLCAWHMLKHVTKLCLKSSQEPYESENSDFPI